MFPEKKLLGMVTYLWIASSYLEFKSIFAASIALQQLENKAVIETAQQEYIK